MKLSLKVLETKRVDVLLLDKLHEQGFPKLSRTLLKTLFQNKQIQFKGYSIPPSYILSSGIHEVEISTSLLQYSTTFAKPSPKSFSIPIAFEDETVLILNKPDGVPSAPLREDETNTAVNFVLNYLPKLGDIGFKGLEPGLLHRLDTGTSGLLAFAKTQNEYDHLRKAWKNRQIDKFYRGIVENKSVNEESILLKVPIRIEQPLAHSLSNSKEMVLANENNPFRGKKYVAITHILEASQIISNKNLIDLKMKIETGVTHQIRCHLKYLGYPILGDMKYNTFLPSANDNKSNRMWLHASCLKFEKENGQVLTIEAPLPKNWPI